MNNQNNVTATVIPQGMSSVGPSSVVINETAGPKHSSLKGGVDVLVGRVTHNMEKELKGNTIVAASKEEKAARFDQKALTYERNGNAAKAQKNREKALRLREQARIKLTQVPKSSPDRYELKALEFERKGNIAKAQKNREKAIRIRTKQAGNHVPAATQHTTVPVNNAFTSPMGVQEPVKPMSVPVVPVATNTYPPTL